jgi:transglutaminase-like putative cysteine protease
MKLSCLLLSLFIILLVVPLCLAETELSRGPSGPVVLKRTTAIAESTEKSLGNINTSIFIILAAVILFGYSIKLKHTAIPIVIVGILLLVGIYLVLQPGLQVKANQQQIVTDWQRQLAAEVILNNLTEYTKETSVFDYSSPKVISVNNDILSNALSPRDAIQMALDHVYLNIDYNFYEPDNVCFSATTSKVLGSNSAQCDTMSIALIGLLRGMGFPARPVGGCIYSSKNPACDLQFSMMSSFGLPLRKPRFKDLSEFPLDPNAQNISRAGGLHLWVDVWLPNEGWVDIESTAGSFIVSGCYHYDIEMLATTIHEMCVSTNASYGKWCAAQ